MIRGEVGDVVRVAGKVADREELHAETLATSAATLMIRLTSPRLLRCRRCTITIYRQGPDGAQCPLALGRLWRAATAGGNPAIARTTGVHIRTRAGNLARVRDGIPERSQRWLRMAKIEKALLGGRRSSIIVGVISLAFLIPAVVGLVVANWTLVGFGAVTAVFLGWIARLISSAHIPRNISRFRVVVSAKMVCPESGMPTLSAPC